MTLRRLLLGKSLQEWREHAGMTRAVVAAELGCTTARIRHLESGRNIPTRPDLLVMAGLYGISDEDRDALLATRSEARSPGWWQTYKLPKWLADYVALENDALSVRNWEVEVIPGLLQTDGYARKLESFDAGSATEAQIERWVTARLERQKRLTSDEPTLQFHAVISEGSVERCAIDQDIGTPQLTQLLDLGSQTNITIRIVPMRAGLHHAMAGGFALLDFPPDTWPATGYQEYSVGGHLVDDPDAVSTLVRLFDALQERALSEADSARLIEQYRSS